MVGVFVAFIRVVYGRMIYMSLPKSVVRPFTLMQLFLKYTNPTFS